MKKMLCKRFISDVNLLSIGIIIGSILILLIISVVKIPIINVSASTSQQIIATHLYLPLLAHSTNQYGSGTDWPMVAANPQRTSWNLEEVRGNLQVDWYRPIEPYIPTKIQPIAAIGKIFVSSARGLYAFNAADGSLAWVYPTEVPLGNSPTIAFINGRSIAYVGGYDRKIHAIDANSGQAITGYTPYEAGAGFETNPLVIDNKIYAGNRDGYFYALDAISGALVWKYRTDGPILFSAAYKDGVLYFASNDSYAYALTTGGSLVWQSQKFLGAGFHSFWPVIYIEKQSKQEYIVFTGSENYRMSDNASLINYEEEYFFPGCHNIAGFICPPWGTLIGPTSFEAGPGSYWGHDTVTLDASTITEYYENYDYRRTVFLLNSSNGQEYTFDSDRDGKTEYAPFTWSGVTYSGNKYPPVINGSDGVYYQSTIYTSSGSWIPRGDPVGWEFGSHTLGLVAGSHAVDEPLSYSSGGSLIYWSLCCDREAGAYDVSIPLGQPNRAWQYFSYNIKTLAPGYDVMYFDGDTSIYNNVDGWQVYSGMDQSKTGYYGKHGSTQSPPIPYQSRLYMLKSNALIAFSPSGNGTQLPTATINPSSGPPSLITNAILTQRLESEVQKIVSAGHLRPGYHSAGFLDMYGQGSFPYDQDFGEIFDYFQNPAETIVTLIQTLPYLSSGMQNQVKTYLQTYYGPQGQFPFTSIVHIGWQNGASREAYQIPQDVTARYTNFAARTSSRCSYAVCGWTSYPPYSFYAALKYAQVFGGAKAIFDQISSKLETPPSDDFFNNKPYVLNQYIAGYYGYLELQKLAGYSESAAVRNAYTHLLGYRANNFLKDIPWGYGHIGLIYHRRAINVAANFMYMTPELGDYLNQNAYNKVQTAINEYNYVAPYWFVSKFDVSLGEGTLQPLYDSPALFQAKAYILKQPFSELIKWLDVPAFYQGDLFYIQNLVAALSAPPQ